MVGADFPTLAKFPIRQAQKPCVLETAPTPVPLTLNRLTTLWIEILAIKRTTSTPSESHIPYREQTNTWHVGQYIESAGLQALGAVVEGLGKVRSAIEDACTPSQRCRDCNVLGPRHGWIRQPSKICQSFLAPVSLDACSILSWMRAGNPRVGNPSF